MGILKDSEINLHTAGDVFTIATGTVSAAGGEFLANADKLVNPARAQIENGLAEAGLALAITGAVLWLWDHRHQFISNHQTPPQVDR